ncbi:cyclin-I2 [Sus scrofa]|uniref:cyclin-I2 n=1 Tax=Sus scrofa TaxID=9823 RepID=UPI000A2B8943|nr:cyclin-I2 [Sus scrofa]
MASRPRLPPQPSASKTQDLAGGVPVRGRPAPRAGSARCTPHPRPRRRCGAADHAPSAPPPPPPPPPPPVPSQPYLVPSDWGGVVDERQLDAHLTQALGREARLWQGGQIQVPVPASGLPGSVFIPVLTRTRFAAGSTCTRAQQVEMCKAFEGVVLWLLRVENIFGFSQTTFNLALTIFSRFILSVKVKRRLFHCVTITSLRLAAKVNEEEEVWVPGSSFQATFEGYGCITLEVSCRVCALGNAHPGKVITFPGSQLSLP